MGKRKSRTSKSMAAPKKQPKLDTEFTCPFCNHAKAVGCDIDRKEWIARAACCVCSASYFTGAHALTEAVDVYSEWIDACEDANQGLRPCS
jgi:transcription elongation factor Elf1